MVDAALRPRLFRRTAAALAPVGPMLSAAAAAPMSDDPVERGEYVCHAAGCAGCHTGSENDGPELAGGVALETPYGAFYAPNTSPHPPERLRRDAVIGRDSRTGMGGTLREHPLLRSGLRHRVPAGGDRGIHPRPRDAA